ncbi:ribosome assembly RNA-binding protein YhbY [Haliea sp. E17]|uniref:ribosome assembly RNA-binding protein YhbY n=1 Tax=Haliea sp. E17 TaxID=3401576 RepID=UPI003AAE4E37
MNMQKSPDSKQLRAIGHKLKPVVTVAGKGLTENVIAEIDQALERHELIKVKLAVGSREARSATTEAVCEACGAQLVQAIGNMILVLRRNSKPDPQLSNLLRPL